MIENKNSKLLRARTQNYQIQLYFNEHFYAYLMKPVFILSNLNGLNKVFKIAILNSYRDKAKIFLVGCSLACQYEMQKNKELLHTDKFLQYSTINVF